MSNNKLNKRKGRKPVAKIVDEKNINKEKECLIVHLPISMDKIKNYNNKNNITFDFKENNDIKKKKNTNTNINNNFKSKLFEDYSKFNNIQSNNKEKELLEQINILKEHINLLEKKNKNILSSNLSSININNNIKPNKNLSCWWCSNKFNNYPVYLPENKFNNSFNVYGYFCSFNCAMAYNIDLDDYKVWERSNLLNQIYYQLNNKYIEIKPAPCKYCLDIYGGEYDIVKFRSNFIYNNKDFRFIIPPVSSIIPKIEELNNNTYIPANNNLNQLTDNLIIKRKKPKNKYANPIEIAMNLKKLS